MVLQASLIVSSTTADLKYSLNKEIAKIAVQAIETRGVFTIALSGGSLPGQLVDLQSWFTLQDPEFFKKWHVILADERCVPLTDPDSNLGALNQELFSKIPIPESQIYGIHEALLPDAYLIAKDYERTIRQVIETSNGRLDLAVLGFGPDGHTCSLFPNHPLLLETNQWVAPIEDSPKPPSKRITLTFPVLNEYTRHVIFCGAGESKAPVLEQIFESITPMSTNTTTPTTTTSSDGFYHVKLKTPAPLPCAAVLPNTEGLEENTLTYIVDKEAMKGFTTLD